jgi:hypothetical protein
MDSTVMNRKRGGAVVDQVSGAKRRCADTTSSGQPAQRTANRTIEKKTRRYLGSILSHCHRIMKSINEQLGCPVVMKQMNREFEVGNGSTKKYDCDFHEDPVQAIEHWVNDIMELDVIIDSRSLNAFARCHGCKKSFSGHVVNVPSKTKTSAKVAVVSSESTGVLKDIDDQMSLVKSHESERGAINVASDRDANPSDEEDDDDDRVTITVSSLLPISSGPRVNKPMIASSSIFNGSSSSSRSHMTSTPGHVSSSILRQAPAQSEELTSRQKGIPLLGSVTEMLNTNSPTSEDLSEYIQNVKKLALLLLYLYLVLFFQQDEEVLQDPFNQEVLTRIQNSTVLSSLPSNPLPAIITTLQPLGKNHQVDISNLLDERESKSLIQKLFVSSIEFDDLRKRCWLQILDGTVKISFSVDSQNMLLAASSPTLSPSHGVASESDQCDGYYWDENVVVDTSGNRGVCSTPSTITTNTPIFHRSHSEQLSVPSSTSSTSMLSLVEHQEVSNTGLDHDRLVDEEAAENDFDIMSESDSEVERDSRSILGMSTSHAYALTPSTLGDTWNFRDRYEGEDGDANEDQLIDTTVVSTSLASSSQSVTDCMLTVATTLSDPEKASFSKEQLQEMLRFINSIRKSCDGIAQIISSAIH